MNATVPGQVWEPSGQRMQVGGTVLRVARTGDGPPLLLLNGIGAPIEMWGPVVSRFPGRTLVMFDVPGVGKSPPVFRPMRMSGYARLTVGLLDRLGIDRADVLGYSWGGALAQQLAHQAPDRVGSLVLGATMPGVGGQAPSPWVAALMATPARYYSERYLEFSAPHIFGGPTFGSPGSSAVDARRALPPTNRGYLGQLYAISGWSSRPWLRAIRSRTLVVAGTNDPLVRPRNARILAAAIPGARLHMVDGGHLFLLENPASPCRVIESFLSGEPVGKPGDRRRRPRPEPSRG